MKQIKHIQIKKKDLLNGMVLKRARTKKHLKYIGEVKIGEKIFKDDLVLGIETYDQNKDDLSYVDRFAKEEIVKKIIKTINGK